MKAISTALGVALLVSASGCMTKTVQPHADGPYRSSLTNAEAKTQPGDKPNPAYHALIRLTSAPETFSTPPWAPSAPGGMSLTLKDDGTYLVTITHATPTFPTTNVSRLKLLPLQTSALELVGSYCSGEMTGTTLTLKADGTYSEERWGCLGDYGSALGNWELTEKHIVLTPEKTTYLLTDPLTKLDVFQYKGGWIFVRADGSYFGRDFYDKNGVTSQSCFQKVKQQ